MYFFRKDIITSIKRYPLSSIFLATIYPIIKINLLNPIRNLEILESQVHLDFNILGSNIAGNFYSNDNINKYLGYNNLSKENGIRLLEEFIEILENNKSN